jgi:hypothetical protein
MRSVAANVASACGQWVAARLAAICHPSENGKSNCITAANRPPKLSTIALLPPLPSKSGVAIGAPGCRAAYSSAIRV